MTRERRACDDEGSLDYCQSEIAHPKRSKTMPFRKSLSHPMFLPFSLAAAASALILAGCSPAAAVK
jgi:hypothetical protein